MYDKADFEEINNLLSKLDWSVVSDAPDVDEAGSSWKKLFLSVVERKIPTRSISNSRRNNLPWIDCKLREVIKQKHIAWKAYKCLPSPDHRAFCIRRNKATSALRSAEKRFLQSLHRESSLPNNCDSVKRFWTYVKRITGKVKGSPVPDLEVQRGNTQTTVTSDAEKANALNKHFAKQTHLENCPKTFPDLPHPSQFSPDSFSTTPSEVYDTMTSLKSGKAPGLDELPPKLLSLCARGIATSLCALYNRSFSEGRVPSPWKEALFIPVLQSGATTNPSKY